MKSMQPMQPTQPTKPIQMYDPTRDYRNHKEEYNQSIQNILDTGNFIMGKEVRQLEEKLAEYIGVKHAITITNGTDALMIALMALGIQPNDEVITVPFTWISTAEVICILGAIPIFTDIDPLTYNIDPMTLENKITAKTKAIIPVSLYGNPVNMIEINKIAEKYNIPIIEDGAQSFGAVSKEGYKSCSCSATDKYTMCKIATTSFFPSKPLGCFGDGGACFTNDTELANKMSAIRTHGGTERFKHEYIGTNGRMNTIQAGILLVKMKYFPLAVSNRRRNADIYNRLLSAVVDDVILPISQSQQGHVYGQYTIRLDTKSTRDTLKNYLKTECDIDTSIFYPIALHTQKAFAKYNYKEGDFPISEDICNKVLSLPCFPELEQEEIEYIANSIIQFFNK